MSNVLVHIFNGTLQQIPRDINVSSDTYQDIITQLIKTGEKSGQIYTMQGDNVDYNAPITEKEIQYVTYPGTPEYNKLFFGKILDPQFIPYSDTMKNRDIYNYLIALYDYKPEFSIIVNSNLLNLDDNINPSITEPKGPQDVLQVIYNEYRNISIYVYNVGIIEVTILLDFTTVIDIKKILDPEHKLNVYIIRENSKHINPESDFHVINKLDVSNNTIIALLPDIYTVIKYYTQL